MSNSKAVIIRNPIGGESEYPSGLAAMRATNLPSHWISMMCTKKLASKDGWQAWFKGEESPAPLSTSKEQQQSIPSELPVGSL